MLDTQQDMDMVWHYNTVIDKNTWIMQRNLLDCRLYDMTGRRKRECVSRARNARPYGCMP